MFLPRLKQPRRSKQVVQHFAGYDHTENCKEGWFYEEENLSARSWPVLRPRLPRTKVQQLNRPHGLYAKNGLLWVDGERLFYNGQDVGRVADSDKQFCGMGAKVLIWPDKLCFDTVEQSLVPLGAKWESVGKVTLTPTLEDGTELTVQNSGPVPPEKPGNGTYWLDTSGGTAVLRVYSQASESWGAVPTTYVKIAAAGIGAAFRKYDTVRISGLSAEDVGQAAEALNTDCILWNCGLNYVTVTGLVDRVLTHKAESGTVTVERRVPDLDYLTQQDNRVWGCCTADHTIYACKLGDPTNWFSYMGTAADSYAVSVGSDGDFTGAASCLGYVLLFKEGCIHKVYGTKPGNYQITTVQCAGVQKGAADSLVLAEGALYYLSPDGPMRYDGSLPTPLGEKLGSVRYGAGCAGAQGEEIHFAVQQINGTAEMLTYHLRRNVWHREDAAGILQFAADGGVLYGLSRTGALWAVGTEGSPYETHAGREKFVRWQARSGRIGLQETERQMVSRLVLRLAGAAGTQITVSASWDDGPWEMLAQRRLSGEQMLLVPITARRCGQMRLQLEGVGDVRLYALSKILEQGSEL